MNVMPSRRDALLSPNNGGFGVHDVQNGVTLVPVFLGYPSAQDPTLRLAGGDVRATHQQTMPRRAHLGAVRAIA